MKSILANAGKLFSKIKSQSGLRIKVVDKGGLGDTIINFSFFVYLTKILPEVRYIDFYTNFPTLFENFSKIKIVNVAHDSKNNNPYDIVLVPYRYFKIRWWNEGAVKEKSPLFYKWCLSQLEIRDLFPKDFGLITRYTELLGKNRYEQLDIHNILNFGIQHALSMPEPAAASVILATFQLAKNKYVTLNTNSGNPNNKSVKCWPISYYKQLVSLIKETFPGLKTVQLGQYQDSPNINCHVNLSGKTEFRHLKPLLKHSLLHIDMEGGLVHLRHALGGVSLVFFGPTSIQTFSYPDNINLSSDACNGNCHWLLPTWQDACVKGEEQPSCLRAISPERALLEIKKYLDKSQKQIGKY